MSRRVLDLSHAGQRRGGRPRNSCWRSLLRSTEVPALVWLMVVGKLVATIRNRSVFNVGPGIPSLEVKRMRPRRSSPRALGLHRSCETCEATQVRSSPLQDLAYGEIPIIWNNASGLNEVALGVMRRTNAN